MIDDALLPLGFGVAASVATLTGGLLALHLQRRMSIVTGFAAGVVVGVAVFDLLPEALAASRGLYSPSTLLGYTGIAFAAYLLLDRLLGSGGRAASTWRTHVGSASLALHSFMDGMGIGLAFQVSADVGWLVAVAVLTHDVADGINTVTLSTAKSGRSLARRWLLANGLAPLLGVGAGLLVRLPDTLLAPLLAAFAGVFLFIGACELVPQSHARDPRLRVTVATAAGMVMMLLVAHWAR